MKLCSDHWTKLRAAIDARGLGSLVAEDGDTARRALVLEMTAGPSIDSFEPLIGAAIAIYHNAVQALGPVVMVDEPDGSERCPLCFLVKAHDEYCIGEGCMVPAGYFESWIDHAADAQVEAWKALAS